ncbi:hypothetical protein Smic_32120 [Streptomyces microflavus]|uniref:Uncharacterized protein n=1 Tax=Streptomyces microflavus TaxID=1919 RepID=A0A7J0CQ81_STRMI|nr:hypothetical protein Smic_32120 [Streptomyces microflavus]
MSPKAQVVSTNSRSVRGPSAYSSVPRSPRTTAKGHRGRELGVDALGALGVRLPARGGSVCGTAAASLALAGWE